MRTTRLALAALLVAAALVLIAYPVFADDVYHSEHLAFAPVGEFPLQSGFVENIHANGPTVNMHVNYVLNGAQPNTTFDVWFWVYPDPGCTMEPVAMYFASSVSTNVAGNGEAHVGGLGLLPATIAPGTTVGALWELRLANSLEYSTQCTAMVWDWPFSIQ